MPSTTLISFPGLPGTVVRALDLLVRMPAEKLLTYLFPPLGLGHWRLVVDFRWALPLWPPRIGGLTGEGM